MINREHIEELLHSRAPDPTLIVVAGQAIVVPRTDIGAERYRGAVEVISRDDLTAQLGDAPPSDLDEVAARLDALVTRLGA